MGHSPSPRKKQCFAPKPPPHSTGRMRACGTRGGPEPGLTLPRCGTASSAGVPSPRSSVGKRPVSQLGRILQDRGSEPGRCLLRALRQHPAQRRGLTAARAEAPAIPAAPKPVPKTSKKNKSEVNRLTTHTGTEAGAAPVPAQGPARLRDTEPPQAAQTPLLPAARAPGRGTELQPAPETERKPVLPCSS